MSQLAVGHGRCVCAIVRPIEIKHNLDIKRAKTKAGRRELHIGQAALKDMGYVEESLNFLSDRKVMLDMGVLRAGERQWQPDLDEDTASRVLNALLDMWCSWPGFEYKWFSIRTDSMPGLAFTFLSADPGVRACDLEKMWLLWHKLEERERAAAEFPELQDFLRDLQWPAAQWSREILLSGAECGWTKLSADIVEQLEAAAANIGTSKVVEDAFNTCRA